MKTFLFAALLAFAPLQASVQTPQFGGMDTVSGHDPRIEVTGLVAGQSIRVHAIRLFSGWEPGPDGNWIEAPKPLHSWADFVADDSGAVQLWRASPMAGTYSGVDAYGLLWSGRLIRKDDPLSALPIGFDASVLKTGETRLLISEGQEALGMATLTSRPAQALKVQTVSEGRLNGIYAAPEDGARYPVLILLHGSEGGDLAAARSMAVRFAGQGYATFAFNYFAWDLAGLEGVPNAHVNQPIEMITVVRDWLAKQPEADVERLGLYGHSKGAEYAELAAIHLPWIKAVVACVPTDVVWQGYGIGDGRNRSNPYGAPPPNYSSFSWNGMPLPYIPLEGDRSGYHNNTGFYDARRAELGDGAIAAQIPVEQSQASFLWLGGGRDEVWASGEMARRLDARLRVAGAADRSELHVYEKAGHGICGDGTYPTRLWSQDTNDERDPDRDADGRATVDGWQRIRAFLARELG